MVMKFLKRIALLTLLTLQSVLSQQIEGTVEYVNNNTIGFGSDLSIPLAYKGISQLLVGSRIYTNIGIPPNLYYRRSTWNLGHRLQYQRDIYTSALSFYSGIEYWISHLNSNFYETRHYIKPVAYLEYTFKRGTFYPQNKKSFKVFAGGSPDEFRVGIRIVLDLRIRYISYYK